MGVFNGTKPKTKRQPVNNDWFKNIAKSFGYTATDMLSDIAPASIEFFGNSMETATDIYNSLRQNKPNQKKIINSLGLQEQYNLGIQGLKNAMEDIKSGKIYNKERMEGLFDEGDEDFGLEDFDFNDDFSSDSTNEDAAGADTVINKRNVVNVSDNKRVCASIDAQTRVIAQVADATITENRQQIATSMMFSQKHTQGMMIGMDSINDNLSILVNFQNSNMNQYIHASIEYYENSLNHLASMVEGVTTMSSKPNSTKNEIKKTNQWDDTLLGYGGLNMKGYMETVKKNLNVAIDEDLILSSIKSFITDTDTMKYMLASPLSFMSSKAVKMMLPTILESSMKKFDNTMEHFFPSILMKISNLSNSDNMFAEMLGKVFGVKQTVKSGVDVANYNKDQVSFDGITRKSIIEVMPTLLSKILSAVSGKPELRYNYTSGKFSTLHDIKKKQTEETDRLSRSGLSDIVSEIHDMSKVIKFKDTETSKELTEGINKFFSSLGKRGQFFNPYKSDKTAYNDIYDFNGNTGLQTFFMSLMKNLDRKRMIGLNKGILESRQSLTNYFVNAEEQNDGSSILNSLENNGDIDSVVSVSKKGKVEYNGNAFNPKDKYNLSSLDYLRRIQNILMEGIRVMPIIPLTPSDNNSGNTKGFKYDNLKDKDEKKLADSTDVNTMRTISSQEEENLANKGIHVMDSAYDIEEDGVDNLIKSHKSFRDVEAKEHQKESLSKKLLSRMAPEEHQEAANKIIDKVKSFIATPGKMLAGVVDKLDNVLFNLVFGTEDENNDGVSFLDKVLAKVNTKLNDAFAFMDEKILSPIHEKFFGEEGIFTKVKENWENSGAKDKLSEWKNNAMNFLFGEKDSEGFRNNGFFSDFWGEFVDIGRHMKSNIIGKRFKDSKGVTHADPEESVIGSFKDMFGTIKDSVRKHITGDDSDKPKDERPMIQQVSDSIKTGMGNFGEAIFGPKYGENAHEMANEMMEGVKKHGAKTAAWGIVGALGTTAVHGALSSSVLGFLPSLFVPGGPIGGALLGMGLSIASRSTTFMDTVFGKEDENGKRVGGMISGEFVNFLKKNKHMMIGGAALGAAKNMIFGNGLLSGFLLPGGPVGGAMMGMATGLIAKSSLFQKLMFGSMSNDTGKLTGGLLSTFKNIGKSLKSDFEGTNLLGNMAVGASGAVALNSVVGSMGLLGSLATPFGPLGASLVGAGIGISLGSKKWKEMMFGKFDDESGHREGGVLGRAGNWFDSNVLTPMKNTFDDVKVNVKEWFGESIAFPFRQALFPIKTEIKHMVGKVGDMFKSGWDTITQGIKHTLQDYVVKPIGNLMSKFILNPLKKILGIGFKASLGLFKTVASAPFKMLGMAGSMLERKQARRGKKNYRKEIGQQYKDGKLSPGEYLSKMFDGQAKKDAAMLEQSGDKERIKKEAAKSNMSVSDYMSSVKQKALDEHKQGLKDKLNSGEIGFLEYINKSLSAKKDSQGKADELLGNTERQKYYQKLDEDKKNFREGIEKEKAANKANQSRRNMTAKINKETNHDGFIYQKDEDGNVISKLSTKKMDDVLSANVETMTKEQKETLSKLGDNVGIKDIMSKYTTGGLDISSLSKKEVKNLKKNILSGNSNDLFKEVISQTEEEKQTELTQGIKDATEKHSDVMQMKVDTTNEILSNILTHSKELFDRISRNSQTNNVQGPQVPTVGPLKNASSGINGIGSVSTDDNSNDLLENQTMFDGDRYNETNSIQKMYHRDENNDSDTVDNIEKSKDNKSNKEDKGVIAKLEPDKDKDESKKATPNLPAISDKSIKALMGSNKESSKKEEIKERNEKMTKKIEENQAEASRRTAGFVQGENRRKEFFKFQMGNEIFQSKMLEKIAKMTKMTATGFDWAFGKKGLLTVFFIAILTAIWKAMHGKDDPRRYDPNGDHIENGGLKKPFEIGILKGLQKGAAKMLQKLTPKVLREIAKQWDNLVKKLPKGTIQATRENGDKFLLEVTEKASKEGAEKAGKKAGKEGAEVAVKKAGKEGGEKAGAIVSREGAEKAGAKAGKKGAGKAGAKAGKKGATFVNPTSFTVDDVKFDFDGKKVKYSHNEVEKARYMANEKVYKFAKDALTGFTRLVTGGLRLLGNFAKEETKFIKDIFDMIDFQTFAKHLGKMIGNGAMLTLEMMAEFFKDKYLVVYGGFTGIFEASRLFHIYKTDIDVTMMLISGAFKAASNFGKMWIIEVINELIEELTDTNIFSILATLLYTGVKGQGAGDKLADAQTFFKDSNKHINDTTGSTMGLNEFTDWTSKHLSDTLFDTGHANNDFVVKNGGYALGKYTKHVLKNTSEVVNGKTVVKGAKVAAKVGSDVKKVVKKIPGMKKMTKVVKEVTKDGTVVDTTVKAMGGYARDAVTGAKNLGKNVVGQTKDIIANSDKIVLGKFGKLCKEAFEKICGMFAKKFPTIANKLMPMILKSVKFVTVDIATKFIPKIVAKISGMAAGAASAGIWTAAEIAVGATIGATARGAADLFDVRQDAVDGWMRAISSVINGILSASWVFVIELVSDMVKMAGGPDFIKQLAGMAYSCVADDLKVAELQGAQEKLEKETREHNFNTGENLSVDEFSSQYANADIITKTRQGYDKWKTNRQIKRETKNYNKEYGTNYTPEQYAEMKKHRAHLNQGAKMSDEERKKFDETMKAEKEKYGEKKKTLGDNMSTLNQIGMAVKNGYGVKDFEAESDKIMKEHNLTMQQMIGIREVIANTMSGMSETTRAEMSKVTGVSSEHLDAVSHLVGGAMMGMSDTTFDKMKSIMNISDEKFQGIRNVIVQTMEGMDKSTVQNMFEAGEITKEEMEGIYTIMDATLNGMSEETLTQIAPLLGISEEHLGAAKLMITETMAGIDKGASKWDQIKGIGLENNATAIDERFDFIEQNSLGFLDTIGKCFEDSLKWFQDRWADFKGWLKKSAEDYADTPPDVAYRPESPNFKQEMDRRAAETRKNNEAVDSYNADRGKDGGRGGMGGEEEIQPPMEMKNNDFIGPGSKVIPIGGGKPVSTYFDKNNTMGGMGDDKPQKPLTEGGMGDSIPDTLNNFAYYAQTDPRYSGHNYAISPGVSGYTKNPTVGYRGCGPTSMAMVMTQLTGKKYLPTTLADMSRKAGHSVSAGTAWAMYNDIGKKFDMTVTNKSTSVTGLRSSLQSGRPVILSGQRPKNSSVSASPFTEGGHFVVAVGTKGNSQVLVNDPRGVGYTKAYDINTVASHSPTGWDFKYNGGPTPTADGNYNSNSKTTNNEGEDTSNTSGNNTPEKKKSILDPIFAITETFNKINGSLFGVKMPTPEPEQNTENGPDSGSTDSGNNGGSPSNISPSGTYTNLDDAIVAKALDMTATGESGKTYHRVANDTDGSKKLSPSVGYIQMRGNNTKEIFRRIYQKLPNDQEAKKWANFDWQREASRGPWPENKIKELEGFLKRNERVSKEVQDDFSWNHVKNTNYAPVKKYAVNAGKISDARSTAHLTDMANTGPAIVKSFMGSFNSDKNASNKLDFYVNQFMTKSWWGRNKHLYGDRFKNMYNAVKNWAPKVGGKGEGRMEEGGMGGEELDAMLASMNLPRDNEYKEARLALLGDDCNKPNCKHDNHKEENEEDDELGFEFEGDKPNKFGNTKEFGGMGGETISNVDTTQEQPTKELNKISDSINSMSDSVRAATPKLISDTSSTYSDVTSNSSNEILIQILALLASINANTGGTYKSVVGLSQKTLELAIENNITIEKDDKGNLVAVSNSNNNNNSSNPMINVNAKDKTNISYKNAKKVAGGRIMT